VLLLNGLNKEQELAVLHGLGPCCVVAGAGSGKTKVLTERIAQLIKNGVAAQQILAVTFTKKAAKEMKERLEKLVLRSTCKNLWMGTFHSICFFILKKESPNFDQMVVMDKESMKKRLMQQVLGPSTPTYDGMDWETDYKTCLSFVSYQKNRLLRPDAYKKKISLLESEDDLLKWKMYQKYEDLKDENQLIDFDDMLIRCYEMFRDNPEILRKYQQTFKYLLIDEFQDTNVAQYELVKMLGVQNNVFVVGDERQSIYSFRGAKIELFINFKKEWPNCKEIILETNYRSTPNIVEMSNRLIGVGAFNYRGICKAACENGAEPIITCYGCADEEAFGVVSEVDVLHSQGVPYEDMAVLYRLNAQSRAVEDALIKRGIPYLVTGGFGFYGRKEVKDILGYVRLAVNLNDDEALTRIINTPTRYLGKVFLRTIEDYSIRNEVSFFEAIKKCPMARERKYRKAKEFVEIVEKLHRYNDLEPDKLIRLVLKETKYLEWLSRDEKDKDSEYGENLQMLQVAAKRFDDIDSFLEHASFAEKAAKGSEDKFKGKVRLMTIHASKGLEFGTVFLIGLNQGILPHKNSIEYAMGHIVIPNSVEEERRICYVGITRAKTRLYLSSMEYWMDKEIDDSMFLEDLYGEGEPCG